MEGSSVADAILRQLRLADVEWIFGNPGTTEQVLVDKLQDYDGIELVLALHEGVAVAAADGYARASGKVGVLQLHSGPGLGNAMGMLYNASAAGTPLVVYIGQAPLGTLYQEPLLNSDFTMMAAPLAKQTFEVRTPQEVPQVFRRAIKVALTPPCGPVVVVVPMDIMDMPCSSVVCPPSLIPTNVRPDTRSIDAACETLLRSQAPAIIIGDGASTDGAIEAVSAIAHLLGAPIFFGSLSGVGVKRDEPLKAGRLPFDGPDISKVLADYDTILAVGTKVLLQLIATEGELPLGSRQVIHVGLDTSELAKNQPSTVVFGGEQVSVEELTDALLGRSTDEVRAEWEERGRQEAARLRSNRERSRHSDSVTSDDAAPMSPSRAIMELARVLPPDACIVDETISSYAIVERYFDHSPGNWFRGRGGGIGAGMAMPIGVQLARPDQTVVCLTGDGSAMYSITSLWTAAHHKLPICWIILNNQAYRLIKLNTLQFGQGIRPSSRQFVGADLDDPPLDFVMLSKGMGVSAQHVLDPLQIESAVKSALSKRDGPSLIQIEVDGRVNT